MKHFVILEWTEEDKIIYKQTPTDSMISDSLTKPNARIKHNEHFDIIMGRRKPICYVKETKSYAIDTKTVSTFKTLKSISFTTLVNHEDDFRS